MSISKCARIVALACLVAVLSAVIYSRGFGLQLGGTPATLAGEHKTEEDWIVTEIVRDITEMSAFAHSGSINDVRATVQSGRNGVYRISAPGVLNGDQKIDLSARVWDPTRFSLLAQAGVNGPRSPQNRIPSLNLHERLTELTAPRLRGASRSVSTALAANMAAPALHESAALTIGAFALREASGRFHDVRWSLNRMTAHLAMARGLSGQDVSSLDGRIAETILLTLANHQKPAMDAIEALESSSAAAAVQPWTRALRLRLTQDWALLSEPARVTLLEKFEYLRARRAVARHSRSVSDFDDLAVNPTLATDWVRILQANPRGVEEGGFLADGVALSLEQHEGLEMRRTYPDAPAGEAGPDLGTRATRCMTGGGPQIIPWGAWAESSQRHLAMLIGAEDAYWRHKLGATEEAVKAAKKLDTVLSHLALYPPATTFRTKGTANGDADLSQLRDAITLTINSPERLTAFVWEWLERASKYEPLRVGMPARARWFSRPSPRMPYDAGNRAKLAGHSLSADELLALGAEAPYDYGVGLASLGGRFGEKAPLAQIQATFGRRLSYDLRALDYALARMSDEEGLELREWACELNATHCAFLGAALVRLNKPVEAAAKYERAFADPTFDKVRLANESGWLVNYYRRTGQTDRAIELAELSARIGSHRGKITAGHLYEDLGRFAEAQKQYTDVYKGYDDPSQLLGFYFRAITVRKQLGYDPAWRSLVPVVFPHGLQPAPASLDGAPQSGVMITKDNPRTVKTGIQAGDIIVGLEGFRVENLSQYYAVNAFFSREEIRLTLWRGKLFAASISAPNRLMGIELRTHPIEGWAEK